MGSPTFGLPTWRKPFCQTSSNISISVSGTQIYEWVSVSKTMMSKEIKTE